ncbi:helix-turn-helix transcriptional regulator [Streptomyces niveiscabiei]|uniref:helix-turn-helix domain-containing protein n=1 Tax=Streptomyces niveiscabiei TaxID=164115 RepID=UPI0029A49423|nr:helix-turn-helix transcriptional regulator [Streptomyces niveiscabiei]MDX3383851.1 helix-turn-helix transcriptional regulator [Streptomyces niveiscabiei]
MDGLEWFGREVAAALEHKGATQRALAIATGYKEPYVSKVVNGKALASQHFADKCDCFFNTPGSFGRLLVRVSERGHPGWFVPYVQLEKNAVKIEGYAPSLVTGLLQTPEYAEAVYRAAHPRETDDEIKARVELRVHRQAILDRENPPLLWVILHEAALRTVVGNRYVMVGQLEHLVVMAASPHVAIQVLPFEAGAPATSKPFILLTQDDEAQILYSETVGRAFVNDSPSDVRRSLDTYERLRATAESEARSLALIRSIMEEYAR